MIAGNADESMEPKADSDAAWINKKQLTGILYTVTAAVIWVLASFVVQAVEDQGLNPFLLSYIANSLFVVLLPLDHLRKKNVCRLNRYQRYVEKPPYSLHTSQYKAPFPQDVLDDN